MKKMKPPMQLKYNFLGLDESLSNFLSSTVAILPVPYDLTTSYRTGTRMGPRSIIEASRYVELFDLEIDRDISELGICTLDELEPIASGPKDMIKTVYERTSNIINNKKFFIMLGGEHSVSIGSAKAHNEKFNNLTVLQFDAHADLRNSYYNTPFSHASTMRRIDEFANTIHIGIRSICMEENLYIKSTEKNIFFAKDTVGKVNWIDMMLSLLSENVYITFDLDALDPSIMPSVGTPEPGGYLWYEILHILKKISGSKNIVGFDIMELSPISGNITPDFLAAKLIYRLIGYIFTNK